MGVLLAVVLALLLISCRIQLLFEPDTDPTVTPNVSHPRVWKTDYG